MGTKKAIQNFMRKRGYDITLYHPALDNELRLNKLLTHYGIDIILDVGANVGQYGKDLRRSHFEGKIVSFEPMTKAYEEMLKKASEDDHWDTYQYALGKTNGSSEINISENLLSSSILDMLPTHEESAPESKYIDKEKIEIKTLDSIFNDICSKDQNIMLKVDTQGFEKDVLDGAEESLQYIDTIQLEMSLVPLYDGALLFEDLFQCLYKLDYRIVNIEHVFSDLNTGEMLQVDGMFHRKR